MARYGSFDSGTGHMDISHIEAKIEELLDRAAGAFSGDAFAKQSKLAELWIAYLRARNIQSLNEPRD